MQLLYFYRVISLLVHFCPYFLVYLNVDFAFNCFSFICHAVGIIFSFSRLYFTFEYVYLDILH